MIRIQHNPDYSLSYDNNFVILYGEDGKRKEYVFYNVSLHRAVRISGFEFLLLELMYKYHDKEYILGQVKPENRQKLSAFIDRANELHLLECKINEHKPEPLGDVPENYYLHLTDSCNLRCTYCYNKDYRNKSSNVMDFEACNTILNKIIPYAKEIVLTGGECFLYPQLGAVIRTIKSLKPDIYLSCISNGMVDYEKLENIIPFDEIQGIMLSCDNPYNAYERKGFQPAIFERNVAYLKAKHPQIYLEISATVGKYNEERKDDVSEFADRMGCKCKFIRLSANKLEDIANVPKVTPVLTDLRLPDEESREELIGKRMRCGAALNVCSVAANGDVFPCQSLHFEELCMGNLITQDVKELRYIKDKEWCLPDVDHMPGCSTCDVRYICGGGCQSTGYTLNNFSAGRPRLNCPALYEMAMSRLQKIKCINTSTYE